MYVYMYVLDIVVNKDKSLSLSGYILCQIILAVLPRWIMLVHDFINFKSLHCYTCNVEFFW